jgi:hypothetical protein
VCRGAHRRAVGASMSPAASVRPVPRLPLGRRGGDYRRYLQGDTTSVCALCCARAATSRCWPGPGLPWRCRGAMRRPAPGGRPHTHVPARSCRKPVPSLQGSVIILASINPDAPRRGSRWQMTPYSVAIFLVADKILQKSNGPNWMSQRTIFPSRKWKTCSTVLAYSPRICLWSGLPSRSPTDWRTSPQ